MSSVSSTDCYDSNANAKPGQTQYFSAHRGDGSYDYNCDGSENKNNDNCYSCEPAWSSCFIDGSPCSPCSGYSHAIYDCTSASNCGQSRELIECKIILQADSSCSVHHTDIYRSGSGDVDYCPSDYSPVGSGTANRGTVTCTCR